MTCTKTMLAAGVVLGTSVGAFGALTVPAVAEVGDASQTDQQRMQRWDDLRKQIFGDKEVKTDDKAVTLDAPKRAEDAALVPITINIADPKNVKALYLVIDDNPSPLAAHFNFGPDMDAKSIKLRVRINNYTNMHAVAETKDGKLVQSVKFVKASGGCSAPMGVSDEEAMRGMGDMKLKLAGDVAANKPVEATLMVRHPNFNGMQMNQQTHQYTAARYIQKYDVTYQDKKVFDLATDISIASNPVISFGLLPDTAKGALKVAIDDTQKGHWEKSFNVPNVSN